jgi:hypothetical protein
VETRDSGIEPPHAGMTGPDVKSAMPATAALNELLKRIFIGDWLLCIGTPWQFMKSIYTNVYK